MSVAELESVEVALEHSQGGLWSEAFRRLRRNPSAVIGFVLVTLFVLVALFAPLLAPHDPREQDLNAIFGGCCPGPSSQHLLGVDDLGRDELSRILYGARLSLLIGVVAVSVGLSIGIVLGSISGFFGGFIDNVLMRLVDIMLAIPGFLMAIGIVALLGPGLFQVMIAIGVVNIPIFTRLLRGSVLAQLAPDGEHRVQARHRVLEDHRDLAATDRAQLRVAHVRELGAVEARAAGGDAAGARQDAEQRERRDALAAARLADDAERLAGRDVERDAVDRVDDAAARPEAHLEAVDLEQRRARRHARPRSFGSSASRRPSPIRLNPSTDSTIATPGKMARNGAVCR